MNGYNRTDPIKKQNFITAAVPFNIVGVMDSLIEKSARCADLAAERLGLDEEAAAYARTAKLSGRSGTDSNKSERKSRLRDRLE